MTDEEVKALQDELDTARAELADLKRGKEAFSSELEARDNRIADLEQAVASKDGEIAVIKQSVAELEQKLTDLNNALSQAVSSYKALAINSNPGVPEELITGDTIEGIDKSLADAQILIDRVRQGLEAEIAAAKVPAGAPQRTPIDLSALSTREKIQYAIGGKR